MNRYGTPFFARACAAAALALLFSTFAIFPGCSDDDSEPPYARVKIVQPLNGQTVRDSTVRIVATLEKNCGCSARMEFWVDGTHLGSDFVPDYIFDWRIDTVRGEHTIMARGVVEGKAEGRDSVRVTVNP
jgi:hypothetical protein